jgi:hypothetical protein
MHAKAERELKEKEIKPDMHSYKTNLVHVWIVHAPGIASIKY